MGASVPSQETTSKGQVSAADTWGGEFHPDFQPSEGEHRVHEHWTASGFANTDVHAVRTAEEFISALPPAATGS